jgi:formate dehydrogenase subunit gamma
MESVMSAVSEWNEARAREIIAEHRQREGATLPILHALQAAFGFINEDAIQLVAHALNLSRAEVHGVVSFYHDFRRAPAGRHVVKLCRAEACQSMGGAALAQRAQDRLHTTWHETTGDGKVTLEPVFCLGLCACAPAAMIDDRLVGRLDAAKLDRLLDEVRS